MRGRDSIWKKKQTKKNKQTIGQLGKERSRRLSVCRKTDAVGLARFSFSVEDGGDRVFFFVVASSPLSLSLSLSLSVLFFVHCILSKQLNKRRLHQSKKKQKKTKWIFSFDSFETTSFYYAMRFVCFRCRDRGTFTKNPVKLGSDPIKPSASQQNPVKKKQ